MALFSNKYSKIFMLLGSFCSNMIFTNSSYSMMMDSCKIDDWSQRQHYVERLKLRVDEELSYPEGLFALLPLLPCPMLAETRENREENLERYNLNRKLRIFEEVSSAIVGTEMKGNPRSYIEAFRALILNGENTPEISRRRPYMVYFLRDNSEYWQDRDLAWNLLAPFRNLKDQEERGYDVRLNFMLSMAEDIFSPLWQRELALSYIEMEYEQEGRLISYKERGRIDEVKRNFKTDASSSPEAIFEKCMVLAKETLHPAPWKEFRPQYPSEHVKLEMMLHTSGNFLKEALENGEIDVGTKYEISGFLHDLAFRGHNPGILGQKLASFGVSYLENLSQNPNASLNFRFEAILKILNRYGYNSFSQVAKSNAREALMEIAFGERTPSESRLRAFFYLSQYKDPSAEKEILEKGYPLIERIFLDPLESTEVRKSASEFFTKEGSLYGVSRYDRAPNFYHRPEERAQKDQKILLQVIKDELVSPDLREFLVDKLFTGAFLRYGEKALLLQEVKDTMGVFYMSALPFFNESN